MNTFLKALKFKKQKHLWITGLLILTVAVAGVATGIFAQEATGVVDWLQRGDANSVETRHGRLVIQNVPTANDLSAEFDTQLDGDLQLFSLDRPSVFAELEVDGVTFADRASIAWNSPSAVPGTPHSLSVNGNILATDLVEIGNQDLRYLCADEHGVVGVCGEVSDEVNAYSCSGTSGTWSQVSYTGDTCPHTTYDNSQMYANGDLVCSSSVPTDAQCNQDEASDYQWVEDPGPCFSASGSCSGTNQADGVKIDWDGQPFEWEPGRVYIKDTSGNVVSRSFCDPGDIHDNYLGIGTNTPHAQVQSACVHPVDQSFPTGTYYAVGKASPGSEPDTHWTEFYVVQSNNPAYVGGDSSRFLRDVTFITDAQDRNISNGRRFRASCQDTAGQNQNTSYVCENDDGHWVAMNQSCAPITHSSLPSPLGINDHNGSQSICVASNNGNLCTTAGDEDSCEGINGCNWNPVATTGVQPVTVTCRNTDTGETVDDQFCIDNVGPKPPERRQCIVSGGGGGLGGGLNDGWHFVCGTDGSWKLGPSSSSTTPASAANNSALNCSGATDPVNNDAGNGGQDFTHPDLRCWNAVPSNCSCFGTGDGDENC